MEEERCTLNNCKEDLNAQLSLKHPKCSLPNTQTQKTLDYLKSFLFYSPLSFLHSLPDPGTTPGPSLQLNNESFQREKADAC